MSLNLNTNVAALAAAHNLQTAGEFETRSINRVSAGLKILHSGDDPLATALANSYRSEQNILMQGLQNATNGLSTLQVVDDGLNNVSQLLDRARTLAAQSASETFTGDRGVLNSEFQGVLSEIDRQAQSIGLSPGGNMATTMSVYVGGAKGATAGTFLANGSITLDLSQSTVDTTSLGFSAYQALANAPTSTDLGTTVTNILTNGANTANEAAPGHTRFYFTGPGFSDPATGAQPMFADVALSGITDAAALINTINAAIRAAAAGNTPQARAFKNAGISAVVSTDSQGHQQLAFDSSTSAFQVQAGDNVANALLGHFSDPATATAGSANPLVTGAVIANTPALNGVVFSFSGLSQSSATSSAPINIAGGQSLDALVATLNASGVGSLGAAIQALGIRAYNNNGALAFMGPSGSTFGVQVAGDYSNQLGFGTFNNVDTTSYGTTLPGTDNVNTGVQIVIGTHVIDLGDVPGSATQATAVANLHSALSAVPAADQALLNAAGIDAAANGAAGTQLMSSTGTPFRVLTYTASANDGDALGWGTAIANARISSASITPAISNYSSAATVNSGGVQQNTRFGGDTGAFAFTPLTTPGNSQALTFSVAHSDGSQFAFNFNLTTANAGDIDSAVSAINAQLQQSPESSIRKMFVVKEQDGGGLEGIRVMSTVGFSVNLGAAVGMEGIHDTASGAPGQGELLASATSSGLAQLDIANIAGAQAAVTAVSKAVDVVGNAQAVIGRGENEFNYAISSAQSQMVNLSTGEARMRDADLAAESANLTKAQILIRAGVAALAQANATPQQVLTLLR